MYILWNNYICTEKQHITLLIYKSTICTSSTYHVWRQISTWQYHHAILASNGSSKQYFNSCQTRFTAASTQTSPSPPHWLEHEGLRAHTNNLKVSLLWTPSQAQSHSKTTTASDSPSSGPLECGSNGSEIVESNNSTAVAYKQNGGTVYRNISPLTKTLLMSAREYNIIVQMRFIPGSLNAIMDTLSRKNKLVPT